VLVFTDPWVASVHVVKTLQWNRSTRSSKSTFSTAADGQPELSQAITTWIETKYHRKRRQRRLGRRTPINFEKINTPTAQAA
jgi:transposase InsO family protein